MKIEFYSQNMEDYFIYRNVINKKRDDGIYIELGAMDGITFSNTLFLEKYLGYKGLLIEPAPQQFSNLTRNRKNNYLENYAISKTEDTKQFIGNNACGGLVETMAQSHINKWHKGSYEYNVKTIPIKKLINKHKIKYIDFFSIDVEGGELEVLETMDWSIPIYLICIELDNQNTIKDNKCRKILHNNNFEFLIRLSNNDFFINKNYFRKHLLFTTSVDKGNLTFYDNEYKTHKCTNINNIKRFLDENDLNLYNKIKEFEEL